MQNTTTDLKKLLNNNEDEEIISQNKDKELESKKIYVVDNDEENINLDDVWLNV